MRRTITFLIAAVAALALIPAAAAKGHPEIRLSTIPENLKAGHPWNARLSLLMEREPWDIVGVAPAVEVYNRETRKSTMFYADETSRTGVFRARVVFPSKAKYTVTAWVDANDPQLPSTRVVAAVGASNGSFGWILPLLGILALAGAATMTAILVARARRRSRDLAPAGQT